VTTGVSDLVSRYGLEAMGLAYAVVGDMVGFKSVDRPYSNRESDDWDTRIAAVLMKEDRCWYSSDRAGAGGTRSLRRRSFRSYCRYALPGLSGFRRGLSAGPGFCPVLP